MPLAFLPLFGKPWRFAAVFGLFYILLASRGPVFSIHFQYSVVLFPVLFALTPIACAVCGTAICPSVSAWLGRNSSPCCSLASWRRAF